MSFRNKKEVKAVTNEVKNAFAIKDKLVHDSFLH